MNLFFTNKDKKLILTELDYHINHKKIDKEMVPFLLEFNKKKDVISKFCCFGHGLKKEVPEGKDRYYKNYLSGYICFFARNKIHKFLWNKSPCGRKGAILEFPRIAPIMPSRTPNCLRMMWTVRWETVGSRERMLKFLANL